MRHRVTRDCLDGGSGRTSSCAARGPPTPALASSSRSKPRTKSSAYRTRVAFQVKRGLTSLSNQGSSTLCRWMFPSNGDKIDPWLRGDGGIRTQRSSLVLPLPSKMSRHRGPHDEGRARARPLLPTCVRIRSQRPRARSRQLAVGVAEDHLFTSAERTAKLLKLVDAVN